MFGHRRDSRVQCMYLNMNYVNDLNKLELPVRNKLCVCGICVARMLGKDLENQHVSMYVYTCISFRFVDNTHKGKGACGHYNDNRKRDKHLCYITVDNTDVETRRLRPL